MPDSALTVRALVPARLSHATDGALYSALYDDRYASVDGALAEARHVFLNGNGLPERWRNRDGFVIVETGFGAGLNFLATWAAWRESPSSGGRLHFFSAEKHPFSSKDLRRALSVRPELAPLADLLLQRYPPLVPGFHRIHLDGGHVALTLMFGDVGDMLRQVDAGTDAFYLDGFAPAKNPQMWSEDVFAEMARMARPGATAATYTVAGAVRSGLAAAGFAVERRPGFGRKREMLVARYAATSKAQAPPTYRKEAVVVGAGLAGTSCAAQLALRGWHVQIIERHSAPAQEASGNPCGLLMPMLSADWNPGTRLTIPAFAYALQWLNELGRRAPADLIWRQSGVLQLARHDEHGERQQRIAQSFALPQEFACMVGREAGPSLCGFPVAGSGVWLGSAGWAKPAAVCQAQIASAGDSIGCQFDAQAVRLRRAGADWVLLDAAASPLARAPVVILANAHAARSLPGLGELPLASIRGQVSFVPEATGGSLSAPVCREGFITPALDGWCCLGASYDPSNDAPHPLESDHAGNLHRLDRLLPGFGAGLEAAALNGRVSFRTVTPDRMPLVGALPSTEAEGLFACLGLGSRGLTWAPLLGEIIACRVAGEASPAERDVLRWIDPQRFARRAPR